jgi:hypothetical protein
MSATRQRVWQGPSYQPGSSLRLVPRTAPAQGREALAVRQVINAFGTGTSPGQSAEAAQLNAALLRLRAEVAESIDNLRTLLQNSEELPYNHVSVKPVFKVQATYKYVGKLKPRRFPLDE